MADNKRQGTGAGIGMASVLMIIVVLALTCVGVLALSSARTDSSMSTSAAHFGAEYYEAVGKLQRSIAKLDEKLADGTAGLEIGDETVLSEELSEDRILMATVRICEGDSGAYAELIYSELVSTAEWSPEGGVNVWDGGF